MRYLHVFYIYLQNKFLEEEKIVIRKQIVILINNIKLFLFTKKMSGELDRGRFIGMSEGRLCYILGLDI